MFKNYIINRLTAHDYNAVRSVWEASVRETHHFLNEGDILVYKSLMNDGHFDRLQLFGVREEQGSLLGFIGIGNKKISLLFISPAARGMGIGKALINYVFQHMNVKEVDVNEQNIQAFDFYRHLGFEVTDRTAVDAIGKPFPVVTMELP